MAEKKQPLKRVRKQESAERKSRAVSRKKPVRRVKEAPAVNPSEAEAEQSEEAVSNAPTGADGKKVLFDSANATLVAKSEAITKKLGQKAEAGDNASAKLLMEMMKLGDRNGSRASKRLREFIGTLESESELMNSEPSGSEQGMESNN